MIECGNIKGEEQVRESLQRQLGHERRVELLTQLTAGLLASGHFSRPFDEGDESCQCFSYLAQCDSDKNERFYEVVDEAQSILSVIERDASRWL